MQRSVFSPLKGHDVLSSIRGLQQKCNKIIDCDFDLLPLQLASEGSERDMPAVEQQGRHSAVENSFLITTILEKRGILQFALKELNQGVCLSKKCRQKGNLPGKITPLRDQLAAFCLFLFVFFSLKHFLSLES